MVKEIYQALVAAKVPDDLAAAAAASVLPGEQAATKADIAELKAELFRMMLVQTVTTVTLVVGLIKLLP